MRRMPFALGLALVACGGGSGSPAEPPRLLHVAGTYQIRSVALSNGCGIPIFLNWEGPATVQQREDLIEVRTGLLPPMEGTVGQTGDFSVVSETFNTEADPVQTRLAGTFTSDGLDATFQYRQTAAGSGELCISSARWSGDKR